MNLIIKTIENKSFKIKEKTMKKDTININY